MRCNLPFLILASFHVYNLTYYHSVMHNLTDYYWFIFTDIDSGPVYHQAPLIMLQNVRSDVRENNK